MSANKVILVGNLGRKPELRSAGASSVVDLAVATSRTFKNRSGEKIEETEWHTVTVWGTMAENCAKYLDKGRPVYVEGRLKTEKYEKDGITRYNTKVIAETVQFLQGGGRGVQQAEEAPGTAPFTHELDLSDEIPF